MLNIYSFLLKSRLDVQTHTCSYGFHMVNTNCSLQGFIFIIFLPLQGESAGPLTCDNDHGTQELVGISSWHIGCGDPKHPGVYTRICAFKDWIGKKHCINTASWSVGKGNGIMSHVMMIILNLLIRRIIS